MTKGSIGTHLGGIDRGVIPIRCRGGKGGRGCKPEEKKGKKKAVSCCTPDSSNGVCAALTQQAHFKADTFQTSELKNQSKFKVAPQRTSYLML